MTDKLHDKFNDLYQAATIGTWVVIVGVAIALGKKAGDFIYSATIGKFRGDIKEIVREEIAPLKAEVEKYKEEVHGYREQHHGVIAKNETVLLQTVEVNNEAFKRLDRISKILDMK